MQKHIPLPFPVPSAHSIKGRFSSPILENDCGPVTYFGQGDTFRGMQRLGLAVCPEVCFSTSWEPCDHLESDAVLASF